MGGFLVPKTELAFFPRLDPEIKNPRTEILAADSNGKSWRLNYIYYNNIQFGGTRNEYRLTGLTAFYTEYGLNAGDTLVLEKCGDDYRISFEKSTFTVNSTQGNLQFITDTTTPIKPPPAMPCREKQYTHAIRPAARIIHTIGQNLIKDAPAAVIELVKNAYDADASQVIVSFQLRQTSTGKNLAITVKDDGHGMTYEQVTNAWLVPATDDKVKRRVSPKGRVLQGNKGIGRFAAFMLGEGIFLRTKSLDAPMETSLYLQSSNFLNARYLDEVGVLVDTHEYTVPMPVGTSFEMTSREGDTAFRVWTKNDFEKLCLDLRRMLFPLSTHQESFHIRIIYEGFSAHGQPDGPLDIEPLPVSDHFDYRIHGIIDDKNLFRGSFQTPLLPGKTEERVEHKILEPKGKPCGPVSIDIRVIDREAASLQELLVRSGKTGESLTEINRAQLKSLLDEASGVSIYRGDFRIRPYGDSGNDWLSLDRDRINNPTFRISNNQVFGAILIDTEAVSRLEEKSARDGLREDGHYTRLVQYVSEIIQELERRRFEIRRMLNRASKAPTVSKLIDKLKDDKKTQDQIEAILKEKGVDPQTGRLIHKVFKEKQEEVQSTVEKLEQIIATYKGQATLGKTVGILLHEGDRSVGIIRNQGRRMPDWVKQLLPTPKEDAVNEVTSGLVQIGNASHDISSLFERIKPLGNRSKDARREFLLITPIRNVLNAFKTRLDTSHITTKVDVPPDYKIFAWEQDMRTILFNLIENSIYWLDVKKPDDPTIYIKLNQAEDGNSLEIIDNGPGIPVEHIQSQAIFEPEFSLKKGTGHTISGLGLPIAGESAARNHFELNAVQSNPGAHFILNLTPRKNQN